MVSLVDKKARVFLPTRLGDRLTGISEHVLIPGLSYGLAGCILNIPIDSVLEIDHWILTHSMTSIDLTFSRAVFDHEGFMSSGLSLIPDN